MYAQRLTKCTLKGYLFLLCFSYVECASDCTKSEIIAQCGREAYSELSLFFRRTMTSIKLLMSLYMSAITNSELKFDDTCDRLGAV
uniref:Secreted protein n=1 Tax=Romanomermis culicivorax TaxID=13658 RepID=A0A915JSX5_ROMCU